MICRDLGTLIFSIVLHGAVSAQTMQSLFQFSDSADAPKWQIVNDGVMGG